MKLSLTCYWDVFIFHVKNIKHFNMARWIPRWLALTCELLVLIHFFKNVKETKLALLRLLFLAMTMFMPDALKNQIVFPGMLVNVNNYFALKVKMWNSHLLSWFQCLTEETHGGAKLFVNGRRFYFIVCSILASERTRLRDFAIDKTAACKTVKSGI